MKNLLTLVMAIGITLALTTPTNSYSQDWNKEQLEVWSVIEAGWANWQKGEIDASLAPFHENYQGWSSDNPLPAGKSKVVKMFNMMKDMMPTKNRITQGLFFQRFLKSSFTDFC